MRKHTARGMAIKTIPISFIHDLTPKSTRGRQVGDPTGLRTLEEIPAVFTEHLESPGEFQFH